ncbi:MAG: minichromosome maintenance protein MCM [Nitrososphaerales archaeon]
MKTEGKQIEDLENFINTFRDKSGRVKYRAKLSQIAASGSKSLVVDFDDLVSYTEISTRLTSEPEEALESFDKAAYSILSNESPEFAKSIERDFHVRISPGETGEVTPLREVTSKKLHKLITVSGMVVRTSELKPLAVIAAFTCKAGHPNNEPQKGIILRRPTKCGQCEETRVFELDEKRTEFIDFQVIRLQELPEELPPGQLPQSLDVNLTGDLVNTARPGDRLNLTGIVMTEPEYSQGSNRLRIFRSRIEANNLEVLGKGPRDITISKDDESLVEALSKKDNAYGRLIQSIAPSVHGHETEKEAILLMLLGSPSRVLPDGNTLRGDLNILLVGDPGTAKSELLKYASRVAPRGLYTSGRGSTAAGLTAAVVRDKAGGMMMLEAGAIVLADQGIAAIDEFDKMRSEDRNALNEAMEQQTVSVAKGGIVATLNARTSILAALNPLLGKYDPYRNIFENVNLPIPLLTRFDLIFVIRDSPDRSRDEKVAKHILELHRRGRYEDEPPLDFDMLRKYLIQAKMIDPVLSKEGEEKILDYYLQMRSSASDESMITVTPRQLEGLIRLATARARSLLHETVTEDDAIRGINLMRRMLETVGVDVKTGKIDLGVLHGRPLSERNLLELAIDTFKSLEGPKKDAVEGKRFVDELINSGKFGQEDAQRMLSSLNRSGQIYEVKPGFYRKL